MTQEERERHVARAGESEFAAIIRNRSGIDAGEIDFGFKAGMVDELSDYDKKHLLLTAMALETAIEKAVGNAIVLEVKGTLE